MVWLVIIPCWILVGWLPTRIMKHYFIERYGRTLEIDEAWGKVGMIMSFFNALYGPLGLFVVLIARWSFGGKWGWRW